MIKNRITLAEIPFPKFSPEQEIFFNKMIELTRQDIVELDPGKVDFDVYRLQFVSLKAIEETYTWLLEYNAAVQQAERKERIEEVPYNPQKEYEDLHAEDLEPEQLVQLL